MPEIGEQFDETARMTYIPSGLNHDAFHLTEPIDGRNPYRIAMLYHTLDWKGAADGINALDQIHQHKRDLKPIFFGAAPRPADLPEWIDYTQMPTTLEHLELYNSCAIFLHTSWTEGFGLTSIESMACGCALVAAANGGVRDYAIDGETALLAPIKDPSRLAEQVMRLMDDDDLRKRLAHAGNSYILRFNWEHSTDLMERLLTNGKHGLPHV